MKFVFILPSHANTNHIKRIEEFVRRGYCVEVFTFYRDKNRKNNTEVVTFHNIGEFSNNLPYMKRIRIMYKGIKTVLNETKNWDCIYYLMRNDIALIFTAISNKPYIFEEADMTHTDFNNNILRDYLEKRICKIIKKSVLSVFRSEGFLRYHFGENEQSNTFVIPNRLHPSILKHSYKPSFNINIEKLRIGFVGSIRYESIYNFMNIVLKRFPNHEAHFYGIFVSDRERQQFEGLSKFKNCFFHGEFKSPDDLPGVYSQIDLVLSTYDNRKINVRYAEPNKLYEAIYFETPIIVSDNTFLADRVTELNVGYVVDPFDEQSILNFIKGLSVESLKDKVLSAHNVAKERLINSNDDFFIKLEKQIANSR